MGGSACLKADNLFSHSSPRKREELVYVLLENPPGSLSCLLHLSISLFGRRLSLSLPPGRLHQLSTRHSFRRS